MTHQFQTRRDLLTGSALQLSTLALAWLFGRQQASARPPKPDLEPKTYDLTPKSALHPPPRPGDDFVVDAGWAESITICSIRKPEMRRLRRPNRSPVRSITTTPPRRVPRCSPPWKFSRRGQCGMEISELLPHTASIADEICLIRSMHTGVNNHGQSIRALQTGRITAGRPTLGSWLTYGLGCEADDLPAFVALIDPGQLPVLGVENWQNGFLPSIYQGTVVRPTEPRILDLTPPSGRGGSCPTPLAGVPGVAQPPAP